ncbi:MAG TPA: cupin domain-containing protein [Acetobacteraceae bacterium]
MARATSGRKRATKKRAAARPAVRKPAGKKAPPKKTAPKKAASAKAPVRKPAAKNRLAKKAAARQPAARRTVAKKTATRLRAAAPAKRKAAAAATSRKAPQHFTVSHLMEADFKTDGLRAYAKYRDLGIAAASGGLAQAHVIRLVPPCTDEVRKRHYHETDLQLVYVLRGWMKNEFEGHGVQMMSEGTCWLQPPGIRHTVLDYSADCEVLEIIIPADFKTVELT